MKQLESNYRKKYKVLNSRLLALVLFLTAFTPSITLRAEQSENKSFKVGVVFALTGQAAYWSDMNLKGILLAKEELESRGYNIDLVIEDTKTTPSGSVTAFNKVVLVDKVDAVIGNIWSYLTQPLVSLARKNKVLLISPEIDCEQGQPYTFNGGTQLIYLQSAYDSFFANNPDIKSTAILNFDDPGWGHRQRDAWRRAASKNAVDVVAHSETAELKPDFRTILLPMINKNPDSFFVAHEPIASLKTLWEQQYKGQIIQSNAIFEAVLSKQLPLKSLEGVWFADTNPVSEFVEKFEAKFGLPPYLEAHKSYEILRTIAYAFDKNQNEIEQGIKEISYDGVAGKIDYTTGCSGNHSKWALFRIIGGKPTLNK